MNIYYDIYDGLVPGRHKKDIKASTLERFIQAQMAAHDLVASKRPDQRVSDGRPFPSVPAVKISQGSPVLAR